MSRLFVIDNSVVMAWCFEEEGSRYSETVLDCLEKDTALVPAIWPLELGNALLVAERRKRLDYASVVRFLDLIGILPIRVEPETPERMRKEIFSLARDQRLSTYDASYLDLAMRTGLPMATQDHLLCKAAQKCKVSLFPPHR